MNTSFPGPPQQRPRAQMDQPEPQVQVEQTGLLGNFLGGVANFFAVETPGAGGPTAVVPQVEEQTESYLPSLDFKKKLEGKSVLLTGGTGSVGSAVAKKLLKCNLRKLVIFVRDRDNLDPKIAQLLADRTFEGVLYVETLDLREPQRIEQRFQSAMLKDFQGVIDTVIICHGIVVEKGLINCTIPAYDQAMLVNVRSVMHLVSLAVPFLKVQKKSSITILTSSQGNKPDPKAPVMSIASAMVQQLIKCAALETAYHGVRVNGVAAGPIISQARTNQQDLCAMQLSDEENKVYLEEKARDVPLLGQLNAPKEIAESLLFLASDDASFCTGEILTVDGGQGLTSDNYDDYCAMLKSIYQE